MTESKNQLQAISDIAWLVYHGTKRMGILNEDDQGHFTYITDKEVIHLDTDIEVKEHFSNTKIFEEQITEPTTSPSEFYLKGYKIYHDDPYPLEAGDTDYDPKLPLYTKTPESDVKYAAGWYCINFEKCWKHGTGPKLSTLLKYGFSGPFRTEQECKVELKRLNKLKKDEL